MASIVSRLRGEAELHLDVTARALSPGDLELNVPVLSPGQEFHPCQDLRRGDGQREPVRQVMIATRTLFNLDPSLCFQVVLVLAASSKSSSSINCVRSSNFLILPLAVSG